jgi:predicted dithiol-disulfide oxidoreductase (DUF899 family)
LSPVSRRPSKNCRHGTVRWWSFPWVSCGDGDFNYDFSVSFRNEDQKSGGATYNYGPKQGSMTDLPEMSAFVKGDDGAIWA